MPFFERWLQKFKKWFWFEAIRVHGESDDVDQDIVDDELDNIPKEIACYNLHYV